MQIVLNTLPPRFFELWHKAEKKKDEKAQFELAKLYSRSKNAEFASKAVDLYKKSASQGNTEAKFALGKCYETGYGVKRNYFRAIQWYKAADSSVTSDLMRYPDPVGDAAIERLRRYYEDDEYAAMMDAYLDAKEACRPDTFEFDLEAAERGDAEAQNSLGHRYYYGRGTEQNYEQALYWYHKSAEAGYEAGIKHLAEHYEKVRCYKESAKWHRKYAELRIKWRNERLGWSTSG